MGKTRRPPVIDDRSLAVTFKDAKAAPKGFDYRVLDREVARYVEEDSAVPEANPKGGHARPAS